MRYMRFTCAVLFVVGLFAATASAATTAAQLVDLSKAGLGDDVLVELIQTDGSTFQLSAADILSLHRQGLSDRVILAPALIGLFAMTPDELSEKCLQLALARKCLLFRGRDGSIAFRLPQPRHPY